MQILADSLIRKLMSNGSIEIDPKPGPEQMQPASVDLRIGQLKRIRADRDHIDISDGEPLNYDPVPAYNNEWTLEPGQLYFFETIERLDVRRGVHEMYVAPRSSLATAPLS